MWPSERSLAGRKPDPQCAQPTGRRSVLRGSVGLGPILWLLLAVPAWIPPAVAQPGQGPAPVGWTEAREHRIRRSVSLSGTVDTRRSSIVASEVQGLVVELAAREGDLVRRGAVLVRLRQRDLELRLAARKADLVEAEARLELAERTRQRRQELFDSDVISRERLDDAATELAAWQGRVASLEAEIAQVEDDLERSVVRAPFNGVVVEEHTQVGEWIPVGGPVVTLQDVDELEVELDVPERYFARLGSGAPARITFEALPGVEIEGKIGAVIPRADRESRAFPVKVRFRNRDHRAAVGMLAQVAFPIGEPFAAVVVPKDAVVREGRREVVYRIRDREVERVEITTGTGTGQWIEVRGPIQVGDRVVTRGNERLRPGQEIEGEAVAYEEPPTSGSG